MTRQFLLIATALLVASYNVAAQNTFWRDANGDLHFSDGTYFKNGALHNPDGSYSIWRDGIQTRFDRNGKVLGYVRNNKGILETFDQSGKFSGSSVSNADGSRICYDDGPQKKCLIVAPDRVFEIDASGRLLNEYKTQEGPR